ncbi:MULTISPECIES: hypothetical protein [Paenibacillus]|uniref:hypothetical protein n=1 Tax=Paenibacillus TaxID=44249 RepID=UPI000F5444F1|nr:MULTISPECIES: hypothetical protein [Paenibacillus]KAA8747624.1 hypothetical protein FE296_21470 [Paenibacillus sp. UASWS1643]RPK24448.1 hypothetical protein EDO6_05392 [Paenibacillus xylanexedens]
MRRTFVFILTSMLLLVACSNSGHNELQSWAFDVVTWENGVYKMTNETVTTTDVETQIGTIKKYSTNESDKLPNLFSNKYKKGTKLFKVKNVETDDYIAVKDNETYYKAVKMDGMNTAAN